LAVEDDVAIGTACMRRIGPDTAEIKRMFVHPAHRRAGLGREMLETLIEAAEAAGYQRIRLDSPVYGGRPRPIPLRRVRESSPEPVLHRRPTATITPLSTG
jgi:GNAT superfamily N-acetyltransferase